MFKKVGLTALGIGLVLNFSSYAASLTREEGKGLLTLTYYYYTSNTYYNDNRDKIKTPRFHKNELNLYLEYGIKDDLMFTFQTALDHLNQQGDTSVGIGDFEVGLQKRVYYQNNNVVSVKGTAIVPGLYNSNEKPYISLGKFGAELSLLTGIYRGSFYIDNQIGFRKYQDNINFLKDTLMIGIKPAQNFEYIALFDFWYGLNGKPEGRFTINPKQRFLQMYNIFRYKLEPTLSIVGGFSLNLYSENAGAGNHLFLGLWKEF